jgi:ABC-type phosphate/phosphonate transport system substrate-binding protein
MNKVNLLVYYTFLVATCLLWAGCSGTEKSSDIFGETAFTLPREKLSGASDELLTVRLAVNDTYCKNSACVCVQFLAAREYEEIQSALRAKYNIELELTYFIDEFELADALLSRKYDGAICKPWFAYMLVPEYGLKYARIADLVDPFENQMLTGVFLVKKDSPLQSLGDVNGKRLAMGQPDSYEKYHMPKRMMDKEQIKPAQIINKASCTESISMLLDDSADVAIVSDYALIASCAADLGKEDDFRIIAKTGEIPLCSVIVDRLKISDANASRLQKALLELSGDNAPESMLGKGFVRPAKWIPVLYTGQK